MRKKTMNKLALAVAFLVAVLLTAGCTQFTRKNDKGPEIPEVYIGTEGIDATFAAESIPNLITTGSQHEVLLMVANKGAVDATLGKTAITVGDTKGLLKFDPASIEGTKLGSKLEGKASEQAGSLASIKLIVSAKSSLVSDSTQTGILATVSYQYTTKLTANVCIDASTYSFQKQRKPCDAKVPVVLKSQGAPVTVKKIETLTEILTETSGRYVKPKFKIYIDNAGTGSVTAIRIDKVELNARPLTCVDENTKDAAGVTKTLSGTLANDFIFCYYEANDFADGSGTFVTPLKAELSYGYTSTSDPVQIRVEKGIQCEEGAERSCSITGGGGGTQKCIDGDWTFCQK
jgi:hypothetical protein